MAQADHHAEKAPFSPQGEWSVAAAVGEETNRYTFVFEENDGKWLGHSIDKDDNKRAMNRVTVDGRKLVCETDMESNGQTGVIRVIAEASADGETVEGTWVLAGSDGTEYYKGTITGRRQFTLDLAGRWRSVAMVEGEEMFADVSFKKQDDGKWTGGFTTEEGEFDFTEVEVEGKSVKCDFVMNIEGEERDFRLSGEATSADRIEGQWVIFELTGQAGAGDQWRIQRAPAFELAGTWDATSSVNGETQDSVFAFEATDEGFRGTAKSDLGEAALTSVTLKGDALKVVIPFGESEVVVKARIKEGMLQGKWSLTGSDGTEYSDAWKAKKR